MSDNGSYEEILDNTVNDAKNQILELEDPDYEKLLELEAEGKNRKTIRQWLEKRLEEHEYERGAEDTLGDRLLNSFSTSSAIVGGLTIGLIIGIVAAGLVDFPGSMDASADEVERSVQQYIDAVQATGQVEDSEIASVTQRNGMWVVTVSMEAQNMMGEMEEQEVELYTSPDGEILFAEGQNIDQVIQQIEMMQQQEEQMPEDGAEMEEEDFEDELEEEGFETEE